MSIPKRSDGQLNPELVKEQLFNQYKIQITSAFDKAGLTGKPEYKNLNEASDILLKKIIEYFDAESHQSVVDAILDAIYLHANQAPRYSGESVILHLLKTSNRMFDLIKDLKPDEIIVALLHDAIEDQSETLAATSEAKQGENLELFIDEQWDQILAALRMEHVYGDDIKHKMSFLIKPDYRRIITKKMGGNILEEEYQAEKNKLYFEYFCNAISNPEVGLVKLADFVSNAGSIDDIPDSFAAQKEKIREKYRQSMQFLLKKLQDAEFTARIKNPEQLLAKMLVVFEKEYK